MLHIDTNESVRFLRLIDPDARTFSFQTFREKGETTSNVEPKVIHSDSLSELRREHAAGAGVYLTINETDGNGRKLENIKRIRAIFQEDDDGHDGPFPIPPSLVVESSPGHFHRYWLVNGWPTDEQGRADFTAVMERMIESYGSDPNAKDVSRVLRLPGFLHRKSAPFMVRIVEAGGKRYSREEILAAFPPIERQRKPHTEWKPRDDDDERIRQALDHIDPDDRVIWRNVGMALKEHMGESGRSLWDSWSQRSAKYDERDQDRTWRSFHRHDIKVGTLFHYARQSGWRSSERGKGSSSGNSNGSGTNCKENPIGKQLVVYDASAVTPAPVEWLWPGRLAIGKTTLIGGDPGLGKSQLSIFVASIISQAGEWPCQEGRSPKRSVIMLSAEDGVADTIVPRLMAAGADLDKVKIVTAVHEEDGSGRRIFNLTQDLDALECLIITLGDVGAVIIDPVDAYIGGNVDSHKNAAVRAVLEPISEMADRLNVAILALTHFSKQLGGKTIYRFIGSIAHIGAARVAFAVIADPEDKTRILLLHAKNNLAPPQKGLAFRIEQRLVADGIIGSSIFFESEHVADVTADEALAAESGGGQVTAKDEAKEFLREVLGRGRVKLQDLEAMARADGFLRDNQQMRQSKPFRSAKAELGVVSTREGFGADAVSYWSLPEHALDNADATTCASEASICARHNKRAHMESEGAYGEQPAHMRPQSPYAPSLGEDAYEGRGAHEGAHGGDDQGQDDGLDIPAFLRQHVCAQCSGRPGGKEEPHRHGDSLIWLHPKCRPHWLREHGGIGARHASGNPTTSMRSSL
jgi:AAA domain/Primase C terminal 2 (PriCT-2)/RepB DNA-primase N-terminal domain